jgi:hypothetical protein
VWRISDLLLRNRNPEREKDGEACSINALPPSDFMAAGFHFYNSTNAFTSGYQFEKKII